MKNPFDTPERAAFRKILQDFIAKRIKPNADIWDEVGEIPWDLHQRVGALDGWGFGIEDTVRRSGYGRLFYARCLLRGVRNLRRQ